MLDIAPLIREVRSDRADLVIVNLGLPLTTRQQLICDAALEAAGRGSIRLDELVVFEADQVAMLIREDDRMVIAGSRRERKSIHASLRKRRGVR